MDKEKKYIKRSGIKKVLKFLPLLGIVTFLFIVLIGLLLCAGRIDKTVLASGIFEPYPKVEIKAAVKDTVVDNILVEVGQKVKKGDVLVHLKDQQQSYEKKAQLEENLKLADMDFERLSRLYDKGYVADREKQEAGLKVKILTHPSALNARWDIFDKGRRFFTRSKAEKYYSVSQWQNRFICQEIIYRSALAYIQRGQYEEIYHFSKEVLSEEEKRLEIVRAKSEEGLVPKLDIAIVEAQVCNAQIALLNASSQLKKNRFLLNHALGIVLDNATEIEEIDYLRWDNLINGYKDIKSCLDKSFISKLNDAHQDYVNCRLKLSQLRGDVLSGFLLILKEVGEIEILTANRSLTRSKQDVTKLSH